MACRLPGGYPPNKRKKKKRQKNINIELPLQMPIWPFSPATLTPGLHDHEDMACLAFRWPSMWCLGGCLIDHTVGLAYDPLRRLLLFSVMFWEAAEFSRSCCDFWVFWGVSVFAWRLVFLFLVRGKAPSWSILRVRFSTSKTSFLSHKTGTSMYDAFRRKYNLQPSQTGGKSCLCYNVGQAVHGEWRQSMSSMQVEPLVRVLAHNPEAISIRTAIKGHIVFNLSAGASQQSGSNYVQDTSQLCFAKTTQLP